MQHRPAAGLVGGSDGLHPSHAVHRIAFVLLPSLVAAAVQAQQPPGGNAPRSPRADSLRQASRLDSEGRTTEARAISATAASPQATAWASWQGSPVVSCERPRTDAATVFHDFMKARRCQLRWAA